MSSREGGPYASYSNSRAVLDAPGRAEVGAAENAEQNWNTYRSEKFGYEISFPAGMKFKAYFDGAPE